jgi:hypothetical protein
MCQDEDIQEVIGLSAKGTELYKNKLRVHLQTIEGFALHIGVNPDTLYEWAKNYPEFSEALRKIKTEQQKRLLDRGLSGDYNPTIAKLVLSANHNMREKQDVTTDGHKLPQPIYGGLSVPEHNGNEKDLQPEEED